MPSNYAIILLSAGRFRETRLVSETEKYFSVNIAEEINDSSEKFPSLDIVKYHVTCYFLVKQIKFHFIRIIEHLYIGLTCILEVFAMMKLP